MERSGRGLIWAIILLLAWRNWRKLRRT